MGGAANHRYWISRCVLFKIRHVSTEFSAARSGDICQLPPWPGPSTELLSLQRVGSVSISVAAAAAPAPCRIRADNRAVQNDSAGGIKRNVMAEPNSADRNPLFLRSLIYGYAKLVVSVAISIRNEWVPESLDLIEICQVKTKWRRSVSD